MSPLYDLILQRKGELQTELVRCSMGPGPAAWGVSAIPIAPVALCFRMGGVMALLRSRPNAARKSASELPGIERQLELRALHEAIEATAQFFKTQRVVACCGDRLTLTSLCLAVPTALPWLVLPPPKRQALSCCCSTSRAC